MKSRSILGDHVGLYDRGSSFWSLATALATKYRNPGALSGALYKIEPVRTLFPPLLTPGP